MNEALKVILSMSFSGGIVIIMLFLVSLLFGKKLSRQWQYYIWLIAIVRLLVPFAPQQNLMNLIFHSAEMTISSIEKPSDEKIQNGQTPSADKKTEVEQWKGTEGENPNIKSQDTEDKIIDETVSKSADKTPNGKTTAKKQYVLLNTIQQYLWLVWILPAVILLIRKITAYESFIKYIHAGSEDVQDIVLLEHFGELLEKSHVRSTVALSVNNIVASPIMIGYFRPCIILPSLEMTDLELEHTIMHELVHYKRKDILYKWLIQFTACIHWFNPLVYGMQLCINRVCELSCDEAVIQELNTQERRAYGDTLLRVAGRNVKYKNPVSSITFNDSKKHLKERLDAIMNFQKRTKATFITTLVLTVIISIGSAYIGVYATGKGGAAATDTSKSKTSDAHSAQEGASAQAPHSVIYKNGEYFILFDNASQKNLPDSTGPDYGITFGAIWPDSSYVSFDSYYINDKLTMKIKKDCVHMQNKGWLTKKEANAIIAVASKVQKGDTAGFQTDQQEEEYRQWEIQTRNGVYYYKNKRIRILMDTRKNRSFKNFNYDKMGKVDLKIIRDKNNSIIKVKYLSKKKAKEMLASLE